MISPKELLFLILALVASSAAHLEPDPPPTRNTTVRQYMKPLAESPRFRQLLGHDPRFQKLFHLPLSNKGTINGALADEYEECLGRYEDVEGSMDALQPRVVRLQLDI